MNDTRLGRVALRSMMVVTGLTLLVLYGLVTLAALEVLRLLWAQRPSPLRVAVTVLLVTVLVGYLSYRVGTRALLADLQTRELDAGTAPELHAMVGDIADAYGIDTPVVYRAPLAMPNAVALGTAGRGTLVLDERLFELLTRAELRAVIAHEMAHLAGRDGLVQTLGLTAVRTVGGILLLALLPVVAIAAGVARGVSWIVATPRRPFGAYLQAVWRSVVSLVLLLLFFLTIVLRAHSRRREYRADDRAVVVTGEPIALARALVKLERVQRSSESVLSPLSIQGKHDGLLTRLLATHPPMAERIRRLLGYQ